MPELSKRSARNVLPLGEYLKKVLPAFHDMYSTENPKGYINLGIAQNFLSSSLMASALHGLPPLPASNLEYTRPIGDPLCTAVIANFMSRFITKQPVSPEKLALTAGASGALDMLAFALADSGDAVMVTGPGYHGLEATARLRCGLKTIVAHTEEEDGFCVTADILEQTWQRAGGETSLIRYVVVCSPVNPTGEVLSRDTILDIVEWGRSRKLHLVFDEVYALSVHGNVEFCSVAEVLENELGEDVHIVWAASKDFCASGLRVGVVLTHSEKLHKCLNRIAIVHCISRQTQWAMQHLLANDVFVRTFLTVNRMRLAEAYKRITTLLETDGVPYIPAQAGFFVWVNLGNCLRGPPSKETEMELWSRIMDSKVIMTPGCEYFSTSYGWFRLCFAGVSKQELLIAWYRIREKVLI